MFAKFISFVVLSLLSQSSDTNICTSLSCYAGKHNKAVLCSLFYLHRVTLVLKFVNIAYIPVWFPFNVFYVLSFFFFRYFLFKHNDYNYRNIIRIFFQTLSDEQFSMQHHTPFSSSLSTQIFLVNYAIQNIQ